MGQKRPEPLRLEQMQRRRQIVRLPWVLMPSPTVPEVSLLANHPAWFLMHQNGGLPKETAALSSVRKMLIKAARKTMPALMTVYSEPTIRYRSPMALSWPARLTMCPILISSDNSLLRSSRNWRRRWRMASLWASTLVNGEAMSLLPATEIPFRKEWMLQSAALRIPSRTARARPSSGTAIRLPIEMPVQFPGNRKKGRRMCPTLSSAREMIFPATTPIWKGMRAWLLSGIITKQSIPARLSWSGIIRSYQRLKNLLLSVPWHRKKRPIPISGRNMPVSLSGIMPRAGPETAAEWMWLLAMAQKLMAGRRPWQGSNPLWRQAPAMTVIWLLSMAVLIP